MFGYFIAVLTDDEVYVVPPELLDSDLDEDLQRQATLLRHGRHRPAEAAPADHLAQDLRHQGPAVGIDLKSEEGIRHSNCVTFGWERDSAISALKFQRATKLWNSYKFADVLTHSPAK